MRTSIARRAGRASRALCITAAAVVFAGGPASVLHAQDGGRSSGAANRRSALPPLRPPEVNDLVERSIDRGLAFLARSQKPNGSWGKWSGESQDYQTYPTAITALVGLVFLQSGSTPTRGPHARTLQRITDHLLDECVDTRYHRIAGLIYNPRQDEERPMYCHAFSMTYLALIYGQERDEKRRERIREVLEKAVDLTARTQTDWGGWGYWPNYRDDEGTLVVTFLQALRSCRDVGIHVPKKIVVDAIDYIRQSANSNGSVRYRANPRSRNTRPGVTCASVVALWQAGEYESELLQRIAAYVNAYLADEWIYQWNRGHHAEYVNYYLAQSQRMLGGERWERFYARASQVLTGEQELDGSWEGADRGDVYGTAIALLILQMPYERLSVYQR